jgi:Spy/CpxP family protein refolding chaperone
MKRILIWPVVSFMILFIAAPLAYTEPKHSMDNLEKGFQQEGPSCGETPVMQGNMERQMLSCNRRCMKGMPGPVHHFFGYLMSLNLDEKQMAALKEIENDTTKELIRKRADRQIAKIELRELLERDTPDLKAVEKKLKQIEALKTESQLIIIKSTETMKTKLTSEQLKMLKKIKPMGHPRMRPYGAGEMMYDEPNMPPPSERERGE